ncbi:MAG: sensor domain-containing diguanylate cyclase [Acidobacteria bacterium]|nr:sensor domain-containing diguanylate cyclase [Acidobacteriota bacterium]
MTAVIIVLVFATILIALASRRWRHSSVPWATVVFFVTAVCGFPMWVTVITALISLAVESWYRPERLIESLLPMGIAAMGAAQTFPGLTQGFLRLIAMFATALLILPLARLVRARDVQRNIGIWAELAATLLLLTAAVLVISGLALKIPLLAVLGLVVPMVFPAFFREDSRQQERSSRLEALSEVLEVLSTGFGGEGLCSCDEVASRLHAYLHRTLCHELTIVAINPAFAPPSCTVAAMPLAPDDLPRLRERSRYLFLSGRVNRVTEPRLVRDNDPLLLHGGFAYQLIIPVWREHHVYALVALLGHRPVVAQSEVDQLAGAVSLLMQRALSVNETAQRLGFLEKQAEQQGRRLRHLLELNQLVSASPDLHDLSQNLVRAVSIAFGFSWVGFMLRDQRRRDVRLLSWAGEGSDWNWPDDVSPIVSSDTLDLALDMGSTVASFHVVPLDRWPHPLPQPPGVQHLLAVPLPHLDRVLGYLLILPHPVQPMPDPEDLRALEVLVEQIVPFVLSSLQIEFINRKTLVDPLTGIANRRSLDSFIERAIENTAESGQPLSFAMVDVDDFKQVNDRYGHGVGDRVLKEIAAHLARNIRTKDFVARYGGEEFSIVLPGLPAHRALEVLDRIRVSLAETQLAIDMVDPPPRVTVSIGVASYPEHGATSTVLLETADMALYRAKRTGKNRVIGAWESGSEDVFGRDDPFILGPA